MRFFKTLSGRFLVLTAIFVMLAEILIFVPSVARFREDFLRSRLERAQIASLALLAGFAVAQLIKAGFQAGGGFPETDTVLQARTVYVALAVGVLATIISALIPALWASSISPIC